MAPIEHKRAGPPGLAPPAIELLSSCYFTKWSHAVCTLASARVSTNSRQVPL